MEVKVTCPVCEDLGNKCFVEQTEVKGKPFESYLCFDCGMTTNSHFAVDSEHLEKMVENNTALMNDLKVIDEERGLVWFPSVINMGERGIIYPEGVPTDWYWCYAPVVDVPEEDRDKYDGHDKRLDIENPRKFGQFEFIKACLEMGVIQGEELDRFKAMTE
jgi:hypothetical protein|tara:strand:+ start:494 stop:976 length:483 start_codon:yes stop_codon:yes gene_type:complete